jgi:transposase InsO family protein
MQYTIEIIELNRFFGQFTSKELDLWAYTNGVTLDFSRSGKPTDNAY